MHPTTILGSARQYSSCQKCTLQQSRATNYYYHTVTTTIERRATSTTVPKTNNKTPTRMDQHVSGRYISQRWPQSHHTVVASKPTAVRKRNASSRTRDIRSPTNSPNTQPCRNVDQVYLPFQPLEYMNTQILQTTHVVVQQTVVYPSKATLIV